MNIDQIMALADDYCASRELRCGILEHRDRLRAAIVEALDMGEPVAWVPRAIADGESWIEGEFRWREVDERPFKCNKGWTAMPIYSVKKP